MPEGVGTEVLAVAEPSAASVVEAARSSVAGWTTRVAVAGAELTSPAPVAVYRTTMVPLRPAADSTVSTPELSKDAVPFSGAGPSRIV